MGELGSQLKLRDSSCPKPLSNDDLANNFFFLVETGSCACIPQAVSRPKCWSHTWVPLQPAQEAIPS